MLDMTFWSFIAVSLVLYRLGETAKNLVLGRTKEDVAQNLKIRWKSVFYETLMFQPVVAGGLMGLVLGATVPAVISTGGVISSVLYFATAGVMSTWIYELVKRAIRKFNPNLASMDHPTE